MHQCPDQFPDQPKPLGLDYRTPDPAGSANVPYIGQFTIGIGAFLLTGAFGLVLRKLNAPFAVSLLVPAGLLIGAAIVAVRVCRWRGFLPGVAIAFGATVLIIGLAVLAYLMSAGRDRPEAVF